MQEAAVAPETDLPEAPFDGVAFAKSLPGITGPLDFFDPAGFCSQEGVTEGKIRFYREVELKHARVAMLAALAFQETPLQTFWPAVVFLISVVEVFSVFTFQNPFGSQPWTISLEHEAGDFGWDPLGLKPTDAKELFEMKTKELNNCRLAMIAIAGMVGQELAT